MLFPSGIWLSVSSCQQPTTAAVTSQLQKRRGWKPYLGSPAEPLQAGLNISQSVDGAALAGDQWTRGEVECMCVCICERERETRSEREREGEGKGRAHIGRGRSDKAQGRAELCDERQRQWVQEWETALPWRGLHPISSNLIKKRYKNI